MVKFSIITVVYNGVKTIGDTLQTVKTQEYQDLEHVIIDGCSTDGTLNIISQYQSSKIRLQSEPDSGIYNAMNKGLRSATGEIVGFLNADDVFEDYTVLTKVEEAFLHNPDVDIVFGDLVYVKESNLNQIVRSWISKQYSSNFFENGYVPPHPCFFVKRSVLLETGGFDETFKIASDYELMYRLLKIENRKSAYIPQTLVRMRLGGTSNRSFDNIQLGNREILRTWGKHGQPIPMRFWIMRYFRKLKQYF